MNKPFFMIPTDFSHLFLKNISGGALKLYLFLGFHSKYKTGESWYTNEEIGHFFEKDPRTIVKWFKELEELGLIFRAQKGIMMKANTFLLPFGIFIDEQSIFKHPTVKSLEYFLKNNNTQQITEGIIFNYGINETSVIIIKNMDEKKNLYSVSSFIGMEYKDIKKIKLVFQKLNIPIDTLEITSPLLDSKSYKQAIYSNIIKYWDEKSMWLS